MTEPLPVGIHHGVPMDRYLADPCEAPSLSSGCAHTILTRSPFHAWAEHPKNPNRIPEDQATRLDVGTLAHELLLEGTTNKAVVIEPEQYRGRNGGVPKGWTNDAIRAARDQVRAAGKVPILPKDMAHVRAMRDVAHEFIKRSEIAEEMKDGIAEATVIAREGDVWMRARPDWLSRTGYHVSFKTTPGSAEPQSFARFRMTSLGYDLALAFYHRALLGAGVEDPGACCLVQEAVPPYRCSLIGLTPAMHDLCDRKVTRAIEIFGECLASGRWPEYPAQICYVDPLPWHEAQFEERVALDSLRDQVDPLQEREGIQI